MSLLHKAITLSGACAIGLTLAFAAPAAADDATARQTFAKREVFGSNHDKT